MQADLFAYTTKQAARLLNAEAGAMRVQHMRTGAFRGIKPTKLPNGRLLWPRAEVLAAAGKRTTGPRTTIDLRATLPWIESVGLTPSDPMAEALAIALNDPRHPEDADPALALDQWHAVRAWIESASKRLSAAWPRLSPEQRRDAQTLKARAIADAVAGLDPDTLAAAVADVAGGAA